MTDLETRLMAALRADGPPARDAMFRVNVLVRLEQARFKRRVARTIVVAGLLALIAGVNAPLIESGLAAAGQHVPVIAFTAAATMCLVPALMIAFRVRTVVRGVARLLFP
jgi:hypothetical protein